MATLLSESVTLEPDNSYPWYITAKRYWISSPCSPQTGSIEEHCHSPQISHRFTTTDASDKGPWTLIFLHSTSFHKETWQPTIQAIYDTLFSSKLAVSIQDSWAIECPNHGQSAVLNHLVAASPHLRTKCKHLVRL